MFEKNNVQKNFKKQMKELEKELKYKERLESGAFTNPYYKGRFYGYTDLDTKREFLGKVKKIIFSPAVIALILILILALSSDWDNSTNNMIKAYDTGNYSKVIEYCDKILSKNPDDFNALAYKGSSLAYLENYEDAIVNLKKAEKIDTDAGLYFEIGYTDYELQNYSEAIAYLDKAIALDIRYIDAYIFKAYSLVALQMYDEADICADKIQTFYRDNAYAYNILGLTHTYRENYDLAIENFEKAIEFYDEGDGRLFEVAYINKAWALFSQQSYTECIEFCNATKTSFVDNYDLPYYMGDCYSILGEHEKAISAYEEAYKLCPEDSTTLSRIAFEYYHLEEYDKSTEYVNKSLSINEEDYESTILTDMLIEAKKPENERIVNFVKENYLYLDKVIDFDQKAAAFLEKKETTLLDIYNFLESVRIKEDMFTFFIFDEYYDMMLEEDLNNKIEYKTLSDNVQYIKINSFTLGIDEQFKSVLKKLPNPKEQTLVIDLCDNPGGLANTANNMLDLLLPECVTSCMVDRTGEKFPYNSDKNQICFKHIYIYVNEESASSSELLTLGLKTYLENVTVIGRPTLGKGVSQKGFESKKNKYMIFLVDSYWNVNDVNVSVQKLQPDIKINGNELSNYTEAMNKHLQGKQ